MRSLPINPFTVVVASVFVCVAALIGFTRLVSIPINQAILERSYRPIDLNEGVVDPRTDDAIAESRVATSSDAAQRDAGGPGTGGNNAGPGSMCVGPAYRRLNVFSRMPGTWPGRDIAVASSGACERACASDPTCAGYAYGTSRVEEGGDRDASRMCRLVRDGSEKTSLSGYTNLRAVSGSELVPCTDMPGFRSA